MGDDALRVSYTQDQQGMKRVTSPDRASRGIGRVAGAVLVALLSLQGQGRANAQSAPGRGQIPAQIIAAFDALFSGPTAGKRAVHAKGILCRGVFTPSAAAAGLSRAVHFSSPETKLLVRFSNFSGVPTAADGDPSASPRGMAIKFLLSEGETTDLVLHSYNGFPARTPEAFLQFLRALGSSDPAILESFLTTHPEARAFVTAPKPAPASYATEAFYGVSAFQFINQSGSESFGRYRIVPEAGERHLSATEAASRANDYLASELVGRLAEGPIRYRVLVQMAAPGDDVTDGSVPWPPERVTVDIGTILITETIRDGSQADPVFMPTSLVDGIEPSDDPMLLARTIAYRLSGQRRHARD